MLKEKIESRSARFGVVGLGYVGLPLAVEFAKQGFKATGFDVSQDKVDAINRGESYIGDVPSADVAELTGAGRLDATTDPDRFREMDVISICVPTPLSKTRDPDMSFVQEATDAIAKRLRKGQLIILESTTYPGTTEEVVRPRLEAGGLKAGVDFHLAFSPERVDPSNPQYKIKNTPKIVGGVSDQCGELAHQFYATGIDQVMRVSTAGTAEMAKLLENTFRSVNIGLVNEVAIMCQRLGLDVWEVIDAAATKPFGFMKFVPGPGLGGHCIPIDPFYLSWKLKTLNYRARFIELAGEINSEMPRYVVRLVSDALNDERKAVKGSRVMVLGVAYKSDVADVRESPALDIIQLLRKAGAEITYHDPYVASFRDGSDVLESQPLTPETLGAADCVVVTTKHSEIDFDMVATHAATIVDSRNAYPLGYSVPAGGARIVKL